MRTILDSDEILVVYPSKDSDPEYCDFDAGVGSYDEKNKNSLKNLCWIDEDVVKSSCGNFNLSLGQPLPRILANYQTHLNSGDYKTISYDYKTIYDYLVENNLLLVCEPKLKDIFKYYVVDQSRYERLSNVYYKIKGEFESLNEFVEHINSLKSELKL